MRRRQRRTIVLAGLCAGLALVVTGPACIYIPDTPVFVVPKWVKPEGSCMCSVCWNQPFCWDPTLPEGTQFYGTPPCADDGHKAVDALRIVNALLPKDGGFFCWQPFGNAKMNSPDKACPATEGERAQVENLDPCVDLPECARPMEQCGNQPPDIPCPTVSQTARQSACVEVPNYDADYPQVDDVAGAITGVDTIVGYCARHGMDPPSGPQPERYCYLSCVDHDNCELDSLPQRCVGCDGNWYMAPEPEQGAGGEDAFPVEFQLGMALVTVLARDADGTFQPAGTLMASGRVHFQVPMACQGPDVSEDCQAFMTRASFASIGALTVEGWDMANVRLLNANKAEGTFVTRLGEGAFSTREPSFGLTVDFGGLESVYASLFASSPLVTTWDWRSRLVSLGVTLESGDGQLAMRLDGLGSFDSLPPTSVASASLKTRGRGGSTFLLSAAGSTDPDGASDIESVTWTSNWNGIIWQASGMTVEVSPPPGNHRYYAKVVDRAASTHTSFVDVTVEGR